MKLTQMLLLELLLLLQLLVLPPFFAAVSREAAADAAAPAAPVSISFQFCFNFDSSLVYFCFNFVATFCSMHGVCRISVEARVTTLLIYQLLRLLQRGPAKLPVHQSRSEPRRVLHCSGRKNCNKRPEQQRNGNEQKMKFNY